MKPSIFRKVNGELNEPKDRVMQQTRSEFSEKNIARVSVPLIILVVGVSAVGFFYPEIYKAATPNWLAQSVGQDAVDLFLVVPVLIVGTVLSFASNRIAVYLWLGTLLYLVYTFLIYCFTVQFNPLFIPYCLILGISFFSVVWFFSSDKKEFYGSVTNKILGVVGVYFIVVAVVFYALWLAEVLPATIKNETPVSILEAGLITNPVHVIDLSLFLPATFMIGVMALRRAKLSTILVPVLLTFFILMDVTIAALSVLMASRNVGGSNVVAAAMAGMTLLSVFLLVRFVREEVTLKGRDQES